MKKYIELFLNTVPSTATQLKEACFREDWDNVRSLAHSMKPQLTYMGLNPLKDKAFAVEQMAKEREQVEQIPALVEEIIHDLDPACQELRDVIKE